MTGPEPYRAGVHKFSSRPAGYDAARQRENQRRHRARVKDKITELETALSSTRSRLDDALKRIESLTSEVQRLSRISSPSQKPAPESTPDSSSGSTPEMGHESPNYLHLGPAAEMAADIPIEVSTGSDESPKTHCVFDACHQANEIYLQPMASTSYTDATPGNLHPEPTNSGGCCDSQHQGPRDIHTPTLAKSHESTAPQAGRAGFDDPNDCPMLPPPSTGESTMPCRDAYVIIKDRSAPEFDLSTATEWLKPGFRRAIVPGTGCRVQTHIVFALVDHITPN